MNPNVVPVDPFSVVNFNLDFGNFDPETIQTDETINAVFVVDTSYSIRPWVKALNAAFNDFVAVMQRAHVADKVFVSVLEFNDKVHVVSGFQPVAHLSQVDFSKRINGSTALYDAVYAGLRNAIDYRRNLENSGIETKTLLFILTDGEDNSSSVAPDLVKDLLATMKASEKDAFTFSSVLFGLGKGADFETARRLMGVEHLARTGTSGREIRDLLGFISRSIASVSVGRGMPSPDF